ncbi:MAG TPA: D-alanine--D-alanine ligase family protein [Actinomycetota bacterium]|nr:D-alanine--D-alanine ligase family protein [Actinomycetota bacterium]
MRRRVAIVFGGRSAEHEISCISARSVMDALDPDRYEIVPIGVTKDGRWQLVPGGPPALPADPATALPQVGDASGPEVSLDQEPGARALVAEDGSRTPIDVVFPVMHGPYGEDGSIQGFLEMAGVPYVGAGVLGSAVGMDKAVQKVLFREAGIPVVEHEVVREREWQEDREAVGARAGHLGYPMFVKPAALGSSVGIRKIHGVQELSSAVDEAFRYGRKVVLERSVEGAREIEVAVLGNDDPVASVAGEIVPAGGHEFYDYEAKYVDEHGANLLVPAELPPGALDEVQRLAIAGFRAVECSGMARVDFFLLSDGSLLLNEINTIPGFTRISMYPKLWEASGLAYPALIDRLVELALERHAGERKRGTVLGAGSGSSPQARAEGPNGL